MLNKFIIAESKGIDVKEKIMSKSEIRDFVIWYMTNKTDEKTLKDYKQFEKFIME